MKRRLWEHFKTLLIVLLAMSAIVLTIAANVGGSLLETPAVAGLLTPVARFFGMSVPELSYTAPAATAYEAARPVLTSVLGSGGRSTAQRDFAAVDAVYDSLGRHLGEALDAAETPQAADEADWRAALTGTGVYFEYGGALPLAALGSWLGAEDPDAALADLSSRRLLLSTAGDTVTLWCQDDDGGFWRSETALAAAAVGDVLETYRPDGTQFAFETGDAVFDRVDPYSIVGLSALPVCAQVTASGAATAATSFVEDTASALSFNPYGDSSYTDSAGARIFTESNSRLSIAADGVVTLKNLSDDLSLARFHAASAGTSDLVEEARALISALADGRSGDGRLYLTEFVRDKDEVTVRFSYLVAGITVRQSTAGAEVVFSGSAVVRLRWTARSYAISDKTTTLFSALQAAALVPEGTELAIEYADTGDGTMRCGWKN